MYRQKKNPMIGALVIYYVSMFMQLLCLYGIFADINHMEAYVIAFVFVSLIATFSVLVYDKSKRDLQ